MAQDKDVRAEVMKLLLWYQGCGFNPKKMEFRSVLEAQEYGKVWVDGEIL